MVAPFQIIPIYSLLGYTVVIEDGTTNASFNLI